MGSLLGWQVGRIPPPQLLSIKPQILKKKKKSSYKLSPSPCTSSVNPTCNSINHQTPHIWENACNMDVYPLYKFIHVMQYYQIIASKSQD